MPFFGYLSAEWFFVTVLAIGACLGIFGIPPVPPEEVKILTGLLAGGVSTALLLTVGKTPEGIALQSSPACKGHPVLSLLVGGVTFVIGSFV